MRHFKQSIAVVAASVPTQKVVWRLMQDCGIDLWVRRDDLLPLWCQGNKFYKLYHNLHGVDKEKTVLSFGGAFSNHIHATALACQAIGLACIGIIRGEKPRQLSPTLVDAEAAGMRLIFVNRADYRALTSGVSPQAVRQSCIALTGLESAFLAIVPEGGANELGIQGCVDLGRDIVLQAKDIAFNDVLLPVATGTTLVGIAQGLPAHWQISGISVLGRLNRSDQPDVEIKVASQLGSNAAKWRILHDFHMGGYAKTTPSLLAFMHAFEGESGICIDHVYTGKLFWAIAQLAKQGFWQPGAQLLALHTGGLQGRRGLVG